MKKRFPILLCALPVLLALLAGCSSIGSRKPQSTAGDTRPQVVATLFPQYDFARRIAGAHANVRMLIPPGVESHSFDPSPADMIAISNADLFFYTGPLMESWAAGLLTGLSSDVRVHDLSQGMPLGGAGVVSYDGEHSDHDNEPDSDHLSSPLFPHETSENDHNHLYDPHIWTSPVMAMQMAEQIRDALCEVDPANAAAYRENTDALLEELRELDNEFREIVAAGARQELVFGSRFAVFYFTREYGLSAFSAYDSCSGETEPAARALAQVIDHVKQEKIPVIFYQELSETKVTETIAEATGARMLLFHSCHNLSKQELERGETYLSLMRANAENLKVGLS